MSVLSELVTKEENRNHNMIAEYEKELAVLPKGSIRLKIVNEKVYYYLVFRSGHKIVWKYLGKDEKNIANIKSQLVRRKHVELLLKKLFEEKAQIEKMEAKL